MSKNNIPKLAKSILTKGPIQPVVKYIPQKRVLYSEVEESEYLERKTPESVGADGKRIFDFIKAVSEDKLTALHSVTVAKGDSVIAEYYSKPYSKEVFHTTYSMCKSITSLAVGILVDLKKLDLEEKVWEILTPEEFCYKPNEYVKTLTVRSLLVMESGQDFSEAHAVTSQNWVSGYMTAKRKKGKFHYNSLNSYLLSVIITKKSGMTLSQFLKENLFSHMGIKRFYWEVDENGYEKGGWGCYLVPDDMIKLGLLTLNKGAWKGRQLISREYIEEMTKKHSKPPKYTGRYDYGYHMWVHKSEEIHLFNGMMGQNVFMLPRLGLVIAVNSGNSNFFQRHPLYNLVEKYFTQDFENNVIHQNLSVTEKDIEDNYCGEYILKSPCKVGVLPFVQSLLTNNYSPVGITKVKLEKRDTLRLIVNDTHEFVVDLGGVTATVFEDGGEKYECRVVSKYESGVLKVKLHFVETSTVRVFEFDFRENKIRIYETPGKELFKFAVKMAYEGMENKKVLRFFFKTLINSKLMDKKADEIVNFSSEIYKK